MILVSVPREPEEVLEEEGWHSQLAILAYVPILVREQPRADARASDEDALADRHRVVTGDPRQYRVEAQLEVDVLVTHGGTSL